jgi:hypothetical protein
VALYSLTKPSNTTRPTQVLSGGRGWRNCWFDGDTLRLIAHLFPLLDFLNMGGVGCSEDVSPFQAGFWHLQKLTRLETLSCIDSQIDDEGMLGIGRITSLTCLTLGLQHFISDVGLAALRQMTNLIELDISPVECHVDRITDAGLAPLVYLVEEGALEAVELMGNMGIFNLIPAERAEIRSKGDLNKCKFFSNWGDFLGEQHRSGPNMQFLIDAGVLVY